MRIRHFLQRSTYAASVVVALIVVAPTTLSFGAAEPPTEEIVKDGDPVGRTVVVILPFAPLGDEKTSAWVGQAIGQTLMSDLSIDSSLSVSMAPKSAADATTALKAGKRASAQYVVYGTYQKVEDQLRITGTILNVEDGKSLAGIKATGALRDLFSLEDTLTHQVQLRLRRAEDNGRPAAAETSDVSAPATKPSHDAAVDDDPDVFADTRVPRSPTIGIRRGAARDPADWDNADLDRLAFSDAGRAARIRYFYEDPYYAFPSYFGGYGYSPYTSGFGYGGYGYGYGISYSSGYGYSGYRSNNIASRYSGWRSDDTTPGYGNTAGGVRMTLRPPGAYGGSPALGQGPPSRQPVRTGGGLHMTVRSGTQHRK